jgi:hypothetical protein
MLYALSIVVFDCSLILTIKQEDRMRSRNIKPGFFENEYLGSMPFPARILFEGLWCIADREGRLEDRPLKIKAKIFPYDKVDDDETWITDLLNILEQSPGGFIYRYTINRSKYIQIVNFKRHQNPHKREKESDIPGPPKKDETDNQPEFQEEAQPRPDQGKAKAQPRPDQGKAKAQPRQPDSLIPDSLNTLSKDKEGGPSLYLNKILQACKNGNGNRKRFNPYMFMNKMRNECSAHPIALELAIRKTNDKLNAGKMKGEAWPYALRIFQKENDRHHEQEAVLEAERFSSAVDRFLQTDEAQQILKHLHLANPP